jgi:hypothetical protein
MNNKFMFIPSSDDEYDWIIESYYQGYLKKNWKESNSIKNVKDHTSISSIDYSSEISDAKYGILMIRQWIELRESQQNIKFILLNDMDPSIHDARNMLKKVQKEGVIIENDNGKYNSKILKVRAEPFRIKNYARAYSIDGLKKALIDNGPALMILPVFNDPFNNDSVAPDRFWIPNNKTRRLGGLDAVVCGYDKNGFKIMIPGIEKKIINFPYSDWGMQWETWSILNLFINGYKMTDQKERELLELERSLVQTPIGKNKNKRKFFNFRKNKKVKIHPAPPTNNLNNNLNDNLNNKHIRSEERLQNLGLKIMDIDEDDSDEDNNIWNV